MTKWRERGLLDDMDALPALGPAGVARPGELESPAEPPCDRSEPLLDEPAQTLIRANAAHENDFAARLKHAGELVESGFGIGDGSDNELGHDDIEGLVGERHLLSVHDDQAFDVSQAQSADPRMRLAQHGLGEIDANELGCIRIIGKRKASADADFQDAPARALCRGDGRARLAGSKT
jgi:hypothetical protein